MSPKFPLKGSQYTKVSLCTETSEEKASSTFQSRVGALGSKLKIVKYILFFCCCCFKFSLKVSLIRSGGESV